MDCGREDPNSQILRKRKTHSAILRLLPSFFISINQWCVFIFLLPLLFLPIFSIFFSWPAKRALGFGSSCKYLLAINSIALDHSSLFLFLISSITLSQFLDSVYSSSWLMYSGYYAIAIVCSCDFDHFWMGTEKMESEVCALMGLLGLWRGFSTWWFLDTLNCIMQMWG